MSWSRVDDGALIAAAVAIWALLDHAERWDVAVLADRVAQGAALTPADRRRLSDISS